MSAPLSPEGERRERGAASACRGSPHIRIRQGDWSFHAQRHEKVGRHMQLARPAGCIPGEIGADDIASDPPFHRRRANACHGPVFRLLCVCYSPATHLFFCTPPRRADLDQSIESDEAFRWPPRRRNLFFRRLSGENRHNRRLGLMAEARPPPQLLQPGRAAPDGGRRTRPRGSGARTRRVTASSRGGPRPAAITPGARRHRPPRRGRARARATRRSTVAFARRRPLWARG